VKMKGHTYIADGRSRQGAGHEVGISSDRTAVGSVQGHEIIALGVDKLDNVNLTAHRPSGSLTESPKGRPNPAGAVRHVGKVKNEETMVVEVLAGETDRWTTRKVAG